MATDRRLRNALLAKLGVTPQRLSQRVAQVKRLYGPMSTEEGTYLLAHQEGVDLTKFLDRSMVDRVREMLPKGGPSPATERPRRATTKGVRTRAVRIAPSLELVDAMLPSSVAEDASRMASIYPRFYVFENSLRNVIKRLMSAAHGKDWWAHVPVGVRNKVADRISKEAKRPWHGRRGQDEIYYSDFGDLRDIITKNWRVFTGLFPKQDWITTKLDELELCRNVLAHNNPLSAHDQSRIDVYFKDWTALLNDRRDHLP